MVLPTFAYEQELFSQGFQLVAGVDEVGRGSWVGPVVAGAVILPLNIEIPQFLRDSKMLNAAQREKMDIWIRSVAKGVGIGEVELEVINRVGIGEATHLAFRRALRAIGLKPDFVVIDAFYIKKLKRDFQKPIPSGDKVCASIAAASIVAKVYRDQLLQNLHPEFPHYNWAQNKGYGTRSHREAIKTYGFSPYHRKSFDIGW